MKKIVLIIMLLSLCLSLAACGSSEKDVTGKVESADVVATAPAGTVAPPETTVPETTVPAGNDLSLGRLEGGTYVNEYAGFACELGTDWTFLSAAELEQIPANVTEAVSGSELAKQLEGIQQFTDMMAENTNAMASMNVLYQKLSFQERIAYMALTDEQIVDATLTQRDMMAEAYAQAGMTLLSMDKVEVDFLGQKQWAIASTLTIGEMPYYTLQLFNFHLGEYALTTTLASFGENNTVALLDLFYALEK